MKIEWQTKSFEQLSTRELFDCLELRQSVFVVEQECPYPDIDSKDLKGWHLMGRIDGKIIAYARLLDAGVSYPEASIGRVVVSQDVRGLKLGRVLMVQAITETERLFPNLAIQIGAQERLHDFYVSLGFKQLSKMYLEDDIPHIDMVRE
jgi:ElaA protein